MHHTFYAALVFGAGASYGIISTLVKLSYRAGFSVNDVSSVQYLFGFLVLWALWLLRIRRLPPWKTTAAFLLMGIPMAGTTILYNISLETLPASLAVIFLFQSIWLGSAMETILQKKWPDARRILSIAVVLFGTVLAAGAIGSGASFTWQVGMLWGFAASLCYTAEITCLNRLGKDVPPITKSSLMVTGALACAFLFLPPTFLSAPEHMAGLVPYGALLTFFGVFLPPLLLGVGMPHISPGLGSLLAASELPAALFFSLVLLGESISLLQFLGMVLILAGIWIGNREK